MENAGFLRWRKIPIEGRFALFTGAIGALVTLGFYLFALDFGARDRLTPESAVFWIYLFMPLQVITRTLGLSWTWDDLFSPTALLQLAVTCLFNGLLCLPWGVGAGFVVRAVSKARKKEHIL